MVPFERVTRSRGTSSISEERDRERPRLEEVALGGGVLGLGLVGMTTETVFVEEDLVIGEAFANETLGAVLVEGVTGKDAFALGGGPTLVEER